MLCYCSVIYNVIVVVVSVMYDVSMFSRLICCVFLIWLVIWFKVVLILVCIVVVVFLVFFCMVLFIVFLFVVSVVFRMCLVLFLVFVF